MTAPDLGGVLRRRAEAGGPAESLDWARYLALVRSQDVEGQALERAARTAAGESDGRTAGSTPATGPLSPVAAEALLLLGEVAREDDDRRAALEVVAARAPQAADRALATTGLGDLARLRRREAAATAHWRKALEIDPACWPAALALSSDEQGAGLPAAALRRLDQLPAEARAIPRVARARVRVLEALGRRQEAEAALAALQAARRSDVDAAQDLAGAARNRGDLARAAALFKEAALRRPDLLFVTIEAARLAEGQGQRDVARALLEEAARRLPDEARVHEELGRMLARWDRLAEALPALRRALALRPQNPTLRRYAERLAADLTGGGTGAAGGAVSRGEAAEDLAKQHAADAEALARAFLGEAARPPGEQAEQATVLLDRRVVRVHPNGLSESFAQRVMHVRSDRAARENQEFQVRYTPGNQEVEIRRARIFRRLASGEVELSEATGRDDRDLSEPWYGLYYDVRAEVVSYEDLRAGDVIEVQYTVADVAARNELADYFGDFQFIAETVARRRWDYTLIGPAGRQFYFNAPGLATLEKSVEKRGAEAIYRFAARDVARVVPEPAMPGFAEAAPYLHVSTYRGWQEVARWYWHLVQDQLTADQAVRRTAVTATAGLKSDLEKVRALHRFVIEGTRYVGLEFGIHGYKPYKVSQVLARRFGDCKDKASLLLALLREVGIESELVLLRTRRGGRVHPEPASLAVFDHAIVYVPRLALYLDGTAEFAGMAELPGQDQGVTVLRVGPATAILTETPIFPSSANRAARTWNVEVDPDGAGRISEDLTIAGQAAPEWRMHYQTAGEREERYAKVWSGRFPGARLEKFSFDGIEDRNRPVVVRSRVVVPRLGELRDGGELQLPVSARDADFVRTYARLSRRRHPVQVGYPWQHEEDLTFRIPEGWKLVRGPAARKERTAFGRFELEAVPSPDGRAVRVRSLVEVERNRVSPAEYPAFRRFLGVIDAALGERIVLGKDGGDRGG